MTDIQALSLHNEDEIKIIETGEIATVLDAYRDDNGFIRIETDHHGFTVFTPDEIA